MFYVYVFDYSSARATGSSSGMARAAAENAFNAFVAKCKPGTSLVPKTHITLEDAHGNILREHKEYI